MASRDQDLIVVTGLAGLEDKAAALTSPLTGTLVIQHPTLVKSPSVADLPNFDTVGVLSDCKAIVNARTVVNALIQRASVFGVVSVRNAALDELSALKAAAERRYTDAQNAHIRLQRLQANGAVIESQVASQRRVLETANTDIKRLNEAMTKVCECAILICDRSFGDAFGTFEARICEALSRGVHHELDSVKSAVDAARMRYAEHVAMIVDSVRGVASFLGEGGMTGASALPQGHMTRASACLLSERFHMDKMATLNTGDYEYKYAKVSQSQIDDDDDEDAETSSDQTAQTPVPSGVERAIRNAAERAERHAMGARSAPSTQADDHDTFMRAIANQTRRTDAAMKVSAYKTDRTDATATSARSNARWLGANAAATSVTCDTGARSIVPGVVHPTSGVRARVDYMVTDTQRQLENHRNTGNFDIGFERADTERDTRSFAAAAIRPVGSAFASSCPDTTAMRIAEFMGASSIFRSDSNEVLSAVLLPLLSENRLELNSADWAEVGYALHTAYGGTNNGIGCSIWSRLTAQRIMVKRFREWFANAYPARSDEIMSANYRAFSRWISRISSEGIDLLRGEDDDKCFRALLADEPHLTALYSSTNTCMYAENVKPANAIEALLNDPVSAPGACFITKMLSDGWRREVQAAIGTNGVEASDIADSFMHFRKSFFSFRKSVYEEVSRAFMHAKDGDVPEHSVSEVAEQYVRRIFEGHNGGDSTCKHHDEAAILRKSASKITAEDPMREAVSKAVFEAVTDLDSKTMTSMVERIATAEIESILTPQDYSWTSGCEKSAVMMFGAKLGRSIREQSAAKVAFDRKCLEANPEFAGAIERGMVATEDIRCVLSTLAQAETQEEFSAIWRLTENAVARDARVNEHCAARWVEYKPYESRVTARTLASFAMKDCPREFSYWYSRWVDSSIVQATVETGVGERYVGEFAARALWLNYVCSPGTTASSRPMWLKFPDGKHYLRRLGGTGELETDIATRVAELLEHKYTALSEELSADQHRVKVLEGRNATREQIGRLSQNVRGLERAVAALRDIRKLFTRPEKISKIIDAMRMIPFVKVLNFLSLENVNEYIIAFENGVTDCSGPSIVFRDGKLEDYLTKTTKISMPYGGRIRPCLDTAPRDGGYSTDHPEIKRLLLYLGMVFPDDELLEYMQIDMASYLVKRNYEKKARLWTGTGNNSKSILLKIIQEAVGEYAFDLPPESLSTGNKPSGSGPSPDLAQGDGAAIGISSEPKSGLTLDAGFVKRVTGGDRMYSRKLFEDGCSKIASYKLILAMNDPPDVSSYDDAIRLRLLIIPFLSTWATDAPDDLEEQYKQRRFKIDHNFERNVPSLGRALAWLMFHRFDDYRAKPNHDTPKVVKASIKQYWAEHDQYQEFVGEVIEDAPGESLNVNEVHSRFTDWYRTRNGPTKVPTIADVRRELTRKDRLGEFNGGKNTWTGYRFVPFVAGSPGSP